MSLDLRTNFGGLVLHSPIVVSACPLMAQDQMRLAVQTAGAGAIILPSLFEEQVLLAHQRDGFCLSADEQRLMQHVKSMEIEPHCTSAQQYLAMVNRASTQMSIPVIASLNGFATSSWIDFAGELEGAGADAVELCLQVSRDDFVQCPRNFEDAIVQTIQRTKRSITVPLFVKLQRQFTSLPNLAQRLLSGADGIVLFATPPRIDICLDRLTLKQRWNLSPGGSIIDSLETIMRVHRACPAMPIAACGGIADSIDLLRALLAGADVGMVASSVYRAGADSIRSMIDGLIVFMEKHGWQSTAEIYQRRPVLGDEDASRQGYLKSMSQPEFDQLAGGPEQLLVRGDGYGHLK